jgi:hypothetical protein
MPEWVKFGPPAVETLGGAIAQRGFVLSPVDAFGAMLSCGVAKGPADATAGEGGWSGALFCRVGKVVAAGALPERVGGESVLDHNSFSIHPDVSTEDLVSKVISIKEGERYSTTLPCGIFGR